MYLTAVIDWYSRYVLTWRLSNSLDSKFCIEALEEALPAASRRSSTRTGEVAFVGELNLSLLYRLTDVWNLRAGYSALWIQGVALAPDQAGFKCAHR